MAKRRSIADGYLEDLLTKADSELEEPFEQAVPRRLAKPKHSSTTGADKAAAEPELEKPFEAAVVKRPTKTKRSPTKRVKKTKPRKRVRTPKRSEGVRSPWGDASVVLGARQVDFIDTLARTVRACGGRAVDRDDVLCALVDALDEGRIDFSRVSSIPAVKRAVRDRLSSPSLFQLPQAAVEASLKAFIPIAEAMLELMIQRGSSLKRK